MGDATGIPGCEDPVETGRHLVREHMPGGSLGALLAERGPMPWPDAVRVGVRIGEALESLHRSGRSHGAVTPDTILVSASGETTLSEGATSRSATDPAHIAHAAPEVLDGRSPGPASDVYALASTIHALISGQAPFWRAGEGSVLPIMTRIFWEPVPDLSPLGVPEPVCAVLERALAKRPADRHPSARSFVDALTEAARIAGETAVAAGAVVEVLPVEPAAGPDERPSHRRGPPRVVAAAAVAVVVAVAVGALALLLGGEDGDDAQARGALVARLPKGDVVAGSSTTASTAPPTTAAPPSPAAAPEPRIPPPSSTSSVPRRERAPVVPAPRTETTSVPVPVPPPVPTPAPVPAPIPTISISGPDNVVEGQTAIVFSCTVGDAVGWYWIDADGNRFGENQSTVYVDATSPGVATLTVLATNADGAARSVTKAYTVIPS